MRIGELVNGPVDLRDASLSVTVADGRLSAPVAVTLAQVPFDELESLERLAELTKPLVRWHELIEGPRPVVAYCPMYKRSWLQPSGDLEIGNPYGGMPRCGEIVSR